MPATTYAPQARKPTTGGGLTLAQDQFQMYSPGLLRPEQSGGAFGDDERYLPPPQPGPMRGYQPLQPVGGQIPGPQGSMVGANGGLLTPPPVPGYQSGQTAAIGTPIPGSETGLGAINNDGRAASETTTMGMQNLIRDQILNMLSQPNPTAQDPQIAGQVSAFNAAQNRSTARQINQNAEAFGAAGLESSGARLAADRGAIQEQGLNEGTFAASAMQSELAARRDQIQRALTLAAATNDQDLARRLQLELANTNAAVQREGLAQTGRLGDADLALRGRLGTAGNNINLLSLISQNRQFNDATGLDVARMEATLNNDAVRRLLGIG